MCGIAGLLDPTESPDALRNAAQAMIGRLAHRGPDSAGVWIEASSGLALGHRRLAVVDLSPAGAQPMLSDDDRMAIVLNGEIYNHGRLRDELGPRTWRGHSDTETLLAAVDVWGLDEALRRAIGMFAFALWDREDRVLTLARDRLGEKPLYYGRCGTAWAFASELKALRALSGFGGQIDSAALAGYLRNGYVSGSQSIFSHIERLTPGTTLRVRCGESGVVQERPRPYWSLGEVVASGVTQPFVGSESAAQDELDSLLRDVVCLQQVADVPLGAFLSGGVDSSLVVALMQQESRLPVRTFTIGFEHDEYDEAPHAREVARHLGTRHEEAYVSSSDARGVIPRLPEIFDEPFGDASQIPTFLVAQMARRHVTVCLSGDGGDELFGGYARYRRAGSMWSRLSRLPLGTRLALGRALSAIPRTVADGLESLVRDPRARALRMPSGDRLRAFSAVLSARDDRQFYRTMVSQWPDPWGMLESSSAQRAQERGPSPPPGLDAVGNMMFADHLGYLPGDVLTKVDRSAMAVSLETRVPLLDHRVVELAWRLPQSVKFGEGEGKRILKGLLARYIPVDLVVRPKHGFGVPIEHWLRGSLRDWADDLLSGDALRREGLLRPDEIQRRWEQHRSGRANWRDSLWIVLMFQAWRQCLDRR